MDSSFLVCMILSPPIRIWGQNTPIVRNSISPGPEKSEKVSELDGDESENFMRDEGKSRKELALQVVFFLLSIV